MLRRNRKAAAFFSMMDIEKLGIEEDLARQTVYLGEQHPWVPQRLSFS